MKKANNKNKIKVGDSVYAIHNSAWGREPMLVTEIRVVEGRDKVAWCDHPCLRNIGAFPISELEPCTTERSIFLSEYNALLAVAKQMEKRLFGSH